MGLLDEAIREHLELKRRGGADPTAVELEEQEALAPVFPEDATAEDDGAAHPQEPPAEHTPGGLVADDDLAGGDARLAELSSVGQDTAELDMRAVLAEDVDASQAVPPAFGDRAQPVYAGDGVQEQAVDWESSGEQDRESAPEEIPGQERLSFD